MGKEDDLKLAEMGYKPELQRNFSLFSILGVGFGLTNSWFGISASLINGISSGGPLLIVYGIIIIALMATCIAITLSEMSSAMPNSGGQYYWTTVLAPKKHAPFLSYLCGAFAWAGAIFTSVSMAMTIAQHVVGMYTLNTEGFEWTKWQVFVAYEVINIVIFLFNCYAKWLPRLSQMALYTSIFSFVVIMITVLVCSRGNYQTPDFVFTQFHNNTGWASSGIAFIVGLINPNWCFSCLDCATHMAEEVSEPERVIPIAIMTTVAMGFCTSFPFVIAMFFCIRNLDDIYASNTGVPILDIFYQALQNRAGALCLETLIVLTAFGCTIASHTWQARLAWSFARDNGFPCSTWLSKVNHRLGVPINAHFMSCVVVGILGVLYLATDTAYNAMCTGCIIFLLLSYIVPTICLLAKKRDIKTGPFWLGPLGAFANVVVVAWTIFAVVFFSFPSVMPVTAGNMNYVSVVVAIYMIYCLIFWSSWGRKHFMNTNPEHTANLEASDVLTPSQSGANKDIIHGTSISDDDEGIAKKA
jgi:choline transport protein